MLNDIWETPGVLQKMLQTHLKGGEVSFPSLNKPLESPHKLAGRTPFEILANCKLVDGSVTNRIQIIGCGTSWHAALLAEYLIEHIARIPVDVQYASEFRYRQPLVQPSDVVIVVSNSGETHDAVESLRAVRSCENGGSVLTVAFVNEADSTIGRESDAVVEAMAGTEVGVAATKVFSSTVLAFALLAVALGTHNGSFSETECRELLQKMEELPGHVQQVLDRESRPLRQDVSRSGGTQEPSLAIGECTLWDIGCQNVLTNNIIFLGRGFNFPIALEGAMKCKEIAYIHAEGYPAAEMKHGPIALIDQFMPVVCITPRSDPTYEKIKANIEEVKARNGATIAITEDFNTELEEICEHVIHVPCTHEYLMPLISVIPLQLLAYMMGILRGNEVDNPRGLQKSITDVGGASS
jgi:glucosamine--fructose-6-phosphate aminotransferase (isomerizing)